MKTPYYKYWQTVYKVSKAEKKKNLSPSVLSGLIFL